MAATVEVWSSMSGNLLHDGDPEDVRAWLRQQSDLDDLTVGDGQNRWVVPALDFLTRTMADRTPMTRVRLRAGRTVGRTLYRQLGSEPSDDDPIIGIVDTVELAALIVDAVNDAGWFGPINTATLPKRKEDR